jgi:hypothetical protein
LHIHSSIGHENFAEVNVVLSGFACAERYKSSTYFLLVERSFWTAFGASSASQIYTEKLLNS